MKILDNFDDLIKYKKILLLYSGGVDSSYALLWAKQNNIEIIAFRGVFSDNKLPEEIYHFLKSNNINLIEKKMTSELVENYISKGILAGGYYQNRFPVSSSYTRPLIAKHAVQIAKQHDCECIVHTANFHQNSVPRFNNSLMHHSFTTPIGIPFIKSKITRKEKITLLNQYSIPISGGKYSIDENIWSRVIENGELDNISNPVNDIHFKNNKIKENVIINIGFKNGLPISINNKNHSLKTIIKHLNKIGSNRKIGRFNGLEDTQIGLKNHEVRESPAAEIIYRGKLFLESLVLNSNEIRLKNLLDNRWVELIVSGNWYSLEKIAIEKAIIDLNTPVTGIVKLEISTSFVFPKSVDTVYALDFGSNEVFSAGLIENLSYTEYYSLLNIDKIRR